MTDHQNIGRSIGLAIGAARIIREAEARRERLDRYAAERRAIEAACDECGALPGRMHASHCIYGD